MVRHLKNGDMIKQNTMIATTIKQSETLINLGVDINTADMWWANGNLVAKIADFKETNNYEVENIIPAWSLPALLSLIKPINKNTYTIQGTLDGGALISFEEVTSVAFQENNIINAVFEMLCYLLENKLI